MLSYHYHWYSITICRYLYKFVAPPPSLSVLLQRQSLSELLPLGLGGVDGVAGVLRHQLTVTPHLGPLQAGHCPGLLSPRGPSTKLRQVS